MRELVYSVSSDGSDYLRHHLAKAKYFSYDKAVAILKAEVERYIAYRQVQPSTKLVNTCVREKKSFSYCVQMVFERKGWYEIVIASVDPTWIIVLE